VEGDFLRMQAKIWRGLVLMDKKEIACKAKIEQPYYLIEGKPRALDSFTLIKISTTHRVLSISGDALTLLDAPVFGC
jgi:hypothetical protein